MSDKAVILLSGGLNSFVAAKFVMDYFQGDIVEAICFNYGQPHGNEVDAAAELAEFLEIPFSVFSPEMSWEMTDRMTVAQADHMVEQGLNESFWFGRDLMIHLLGASRAKALGAKVVVTGATMARVDRKALELLEAAIGASGSGVIFEHPFLGTPPGHSFKVAHDLGIWDHAVMDTVDCLSTDGMNQNSWGWGCGECEGCKIRKHGFEQALAIIKSANELEVQ